MAKPKKEAPPEEDEDTEDPKAKGKGKAKEKAKATAKSKGKDDDAPEAEDGADGEDAEGEGEKKKLPIVKLAIFAGIPLVLIIAGVVAALVLGVFGGKHPAKEAKAAAKPAADEVQFYDVPEILVNLNTGGKSQTYLKLQVALEIPKTAQIAALEPELPRILDRFQVFLRELRLEDLNGSAGTYRLKQELLRRVRLSGLSVPVDDVLIREMIIQ
jgi:flagellar protein FliL